MILSFGQNRTIGDLESFFGLRNSEEKALHSVFQITTGKWFGIHVMFHITPLKHRL